jgi:oxalate decarboxylase
MERPKERQQTMADIVQQDGANLSRRNFLGRGSAALAAAATLPVLSSAQQTRDLSGDKHQGVNETRPGTINKTLDSSEPDSVFPPTTDAGGQPPFKYPY